MLTQGAFLFESSLGYVKVRNFLQVSYVYRYENLYSPLRYTHYVLKYLLEEKLTDFQVRYVFDRFKF